MALVFPKVAGGDWVDDLRVLACVEGFCRVLKEAEGFGLTRGERLRQQPFGAWGIG